MRRKTKEYIILSILLLLTSCGGNKVMRELSDIESYIDTHPDSALVTIRQIDTLSLKTKAQKAKYFLLHTIALDKNGIDTSDPRFIMPAVVWYDRHGKPEDRLKSNMYLGIVQYNGELFNQAIESFYNASEEAAKVGDYNILGILYSRIAVTYMQTRDYSQAADYLDKAIDSFRKCGRKDNENTILLNKVRNLVQLRQWKDAETVITQALSDDTIDKQKKGILLVDYAMTLLYTEEDKDPLALSYFSEALSEEVSLVDQEEMCAYAYALGANGLKEESDSVFNLARSFAGSDYSYNYWKHRLSIKNSDYKGGYMYLRSAMWINDSIMASDYSSSVANSGRAFLENRNLEKDYELQKHRYLSIIISLACLVFALVVLLLWRIIHEKQKEYTENKARMEIAIESLKDQILVMRQKVVNGRSKFSLLSDIYDKIYRHSAGEKLDDERLVSELRSRIGNLRSDPNAQQRFEDMLDKESGGLMSSFRKDYPYLSESEYRMASYYFAGFDTTTVTLIMDISNPENTRVKKSRLKHKIMESPNENREVYLSFF